jgi:dipeptidyl aminopeptidase/acylaminoacyl peptidase
MIVNAKESKMWKITRRFIVVAVTLMLNHLSAPLVMNAMDCEDRIVFSHFDTYLFTVGHTGDPINLSNGPNGSSGEFGLDGAPDGNQIAYIEAPNTLTILTLDSRETRSFTYPDTNLFYVKWSPKGDWIATFMCERTSDTRPCFLRLLDPIDGEMLQISNAYSERNPGHMSWSPDGSQIAFIARERSDSNQDLINILSLDDFQVELFHGISTATWSDLEWSPNGQYLAYETADANSQTSTLHVVDLDGTSILALSNQTPSVIRWSYDSRYIAHENNQNLFIIDLETGENRPVSLGLSLEPNMGYEWSPTDHKIVVVNPHMWIIDIVSGTSTQVDSTYNFVINHIVWMNCPDNIASTANSKDMKHADNLDSFC